MLTAYDNNVSYYVVPFEEDEKDPSVWFLDHNYVENMNEMFKKVNGSCFYSFSMFNMTNVCRFIHNNLLSRN